VIPWLICFTCNLCRYTEALRIHSENAERSKREREAAAATAVASTAAAAAAAGVPFLDARPSRSNNRSSSKNSSGNAATNTNALRQIADTGAGAAGAASAKVATAEMRERSAQLAEELTRAERRLEQALATTAAALDAAERGAAIAGENASLESRAIAVRVDETDEVAALISRRADALTLAVEKGAVAASAARWAHVSRCNRYRDLLRRLLDEHTSDRRAAAAALAAAETREMEAKREAEEVRGFVVGKPRTKRKEPKKPSQTCPS
jgi:hypothetical protein